MQRMPQPGGRWMVLIAGPVRSGKSTLARCIAERFDGICVGFGDAVRRRTLALGLAANRSAWQQVGEEWAAGDPGGLCDAVLAAAAGSARVVVDGVRHRHIRDLLLARAGDRPAVLVYVHADMHVRRARLGRDGMSGTAMDRVLSHSTEKELPWLRDAADVVADGTADPEQVLTALERLISGGAGHNSR